MPDLSGSDSESSSTGESDTKSSEDSTDSEDSESTTDIDSESTSGDDDIGATGSEAVPTSLSVEAGGQRIGYLMLVQDYGLYIWDDVNEVTFSVNQQTGHVVGGSGGYYYATPDCTGTAYINTNVQVGICNQVPAPVRRSVSADAPFGGGHVLAHVSTNVIPQTFALPITVVETAP